MRAAFRELSELADAVQLTPGNIPTPGFVPSGPLHHGFDPDRRSVPVWRGAELLVRDRSVHPPETHHTSFRELAEAAERGFAATLETMYPGYLLGNGDELVWAMERKLPLAVDVSHLAIEREAGVLSDEVLARVLEYDRIEEVHVSRSVKMRDAHAPIDASTFGLEWVRARLRAGTLVVLECYMHKLSREERRRQIDWVRGG